MRIDPQAVQAQAQVLAATSKPQRRATARFSLDDTPAPARTSAARAAIPLATLDAILALQGEDYPAERRRRHAKRGRDILDALDALKAAILAGRIAPSDLRRVVSRLRQDIGPSGDPALDQIMAEIELRAEVELAKLAAAGLKP
ncbi:MAG TPA: flagellar assembly protein FliX [Enterovirga sp.]